MSAPLFIAEVSSNHHRDPDRCLAFIDAAAELGCGAVKFQLFKVDRLFAPEILAHSENHRRRRQWELPPALLPVLAERCRTRGLALACTPFDEDAVAVLEPHVAFYKIASYELLWDGLLRACARTGKPVFLSTGMADLEEATRAAQVLRAAGCRELTLLHCSSAYPTPADQANLAAIETLRNAVDCPVGWSDHTRAPGVIHRAVHRWRAAAVEFHLDLDRRGDEYNAGHCWLPEEIGPVIDQIRQGAGADGDGRKRPNPAELADRDWRADPEDGLRPLKETRRRWIEDHERR